MQRANETIPAPQPSAPANTRVKFKDVFKYSPHGWDIVKFKPTETGTVPKHIADIAVAEGKGEILADEEEIKDEKPAAKTPAARR